MKTKILFVFAIIFAIVLFGLIILGLFDKDLSYVFSFFKREKQEVYTPTYLPINSANFAKIALKTATTENKIPSAINAESLGYYIADNPENYAHINYIPDTVRYQLAGIFMEKYKFSSIVIICREGSHLPFTYEDFLNLSSYKDELYLIEKKKSFQRIPAYVVWVGDSLYLYDNKLRELLRR